MSLRKTLLTLAVLLVTSRSVLAGDCCCPDCGAKTCSPSWVPVTEKHHCYEVECKDICIPKFSWPWEKCCTPKCGRVKTVKVLKKVDYKCETCGCKWEVQCVECCNQPKCLDIPSREVQPPLPPAADTRAIPHRPSSEVGSPRFGATRGPKGKTTGGIFQMFVFSNK